jgi:hypothetical protein
MSNQYIMNITLLNQDDMYRTMIDNDFRNK